MSNIPQAKRILDKLLGRRPLEGSGAQMTVFVRRELLRVRGLLDRERPEYRAPTLPPMTVEEVATAIRLREMGWPINRIARHLGTNIGRVSEAINGKRCGL